MRTERSEERLHHFRCGACGRWWTIGDAPKARNEWFCPWCGKNGKVTNVNNKKKK